MTADDPAYFFHLPPELIAQAPAPRRADSRLLCLERNGGLIGEHVFREIADLLRPGDLLVLNDSRVLPARLWTRRVASGGRVELLLVRPQADGSWLAMARPTRRLRPGQALQVQAKTDAVEPGPRVKITDVLGDGFVVVAVPGNHPQNTLESIAESYGEMPLPPYIRRDPAAQDGAETTRLDHQRYQTVYARQSGSVAAPTAGLHFESELLDRLRQRGIGTAWITLHVGPGTFRPPTAEQIAGRRLHRETFQYPVATDSAIRRTRRTGGRIFAVGTTSLRVLATVQSLALDAGPTTVRKWPAAADSSPGRFVGNARYVRSKREGADFGYTTGDAADKTEAGWEVVGETRLFIRPPDEVTAVDGLLTNFHLPGSSLLMLVAAFAGETTWRRAYAHAVDAGFRFYSYGDAMLILPADRP
ncbi:MAG: S-adenosylmethionine:tRNA ribosyltransferase-isomerase [bacterium]